MVAAMMTPTMAPATFRTAKSFGSRPERLAAAAAIHDLTLVVTLGKRGALSAHGSEMLRVQAPSVRTIDTTGAGDIFHAGFIYGLLQGWSLPRQLDFACAAAALNCTASGARGGIGPVEAIESLMATGARYAVAPAAD